MIAAHRLRLAYGTRTILDDVSFEIRSGELLAIVGPNGAGKTSLLRSLAGTHRPAAGTIDLDGRALAGVAARERGKRLAFVEAEGPVPDGMTVRDVVANGRLPYRAWWSWAASPEDQTAVDDALERTALVELADRPFSACSSGERQRGWIALALAQRAQTILLDEPTSHLDVRHAFEALELLRTIAASGRAIAAVLHDLNLAAAFADRVAVFGEGRLLACGTPGESLRPEILSLAYGVTIDVRRDGDRLIVVPFRKRSA